MIILKHILVCKDTLVSTDFYNYILWFIIDIVKDYYIIKIH